MSGMSRASATCVGETSSTPGSTTAKGERRKSWYLTAVTVFKDEAANLEEWLAFCTMQGVERFLLYNNGSSDDFAAVLRPWIAAGLVELIDWPLHWEQGAQTKAFLDALERLR